MKLSLRLPRREVLIIAAAALIAVIITLAVLAGSSRAADRRRGLNAPAAPASQRAEIREQPGLSLEDFIIPEAPRPSPLPRYYPFRPRIETWNPQLVEKFWVPPRQVAIDVLGAVNDRNMEEIFKDVR